MTVDDSTWPPAVYDPPPWSERCDPLRRHLLLDEEVFGMLLAGHVEWPLAQALLEMNEEASRSGHGWHRAQAWFRVCSPGATGTDLVVAAMYEAFTSTQLDSLPAPMADGANPMELLMLRVHGLNSGGEDLPTIGDEELRRRMVRAQELGQDGKPTDWLRGYVSLLVAEARRRRGQ